MNRRIQARNLADLYRQAAERWRGRPAFSTRTNGEWTSVTFDDLHERGLSLATALIELGAEARSFVGLFGDNREEWILADYGVQFCGAADVPRGRDVTDGELAYILDHARIRIAFVETEALQERVLRLRNKLAGPETLILLDPNAKAAPGVFRLNDLISRGAELRASGDRRAEERIRNINSDDLFTLIYTSGTTGDPKGVMLTHANMMYQIEAVPIAIGPTDRILSILPVWHIFERVFNVLAIACGAATHYSSPRSLVEDLKTVRPTFMGSAPRLWESLHQRILKGVDAAPPIRRRLFHLAHATGRRFRDSAFYLRGWSLQLEPETRFQRCVRTPLHAIRWLGLLPLFLLFDRLVFKQIRLAIGGCLKATVSGGGALPETIDRFFNTIGIPVLEGYGLTETAPVLAVRTMEKRVIGTVGPVLEGTEIRIRHPEDRHVLFPNEKLPGHGRGARGEIWVRGPQVMRGYYRDAEATARVLKDGWFRTGDLGMITYNDCLKILGRSKETIVLSNGENLEPGLIEQRLQQSPLIGQCMIVGQDRRFIAALIVPNPDGLRAVGVKERSPEAISTSPAAIQSIRVEIRRRISPENGFKSFERIVDFRLLPKAFTVGDELTNLFKLKRHVVEEKYADLIREMFDGR